MTNFLNYNGVSVVRDEKKDKIDNNLACDHGKQDCEPRVSHKF